MLPLALLLHDAVELDHHAGHLPPLLGPLDAPGPLDDALDLDGQELRRVDGDRLPGGLGLGADLELDLGLLQRLVEEPRVGEGMGGDGGHDLLQTGRV